MKDARRLVDLDISFTDLKVREICQLTEVIASNRKLKYLNLSWNEASTKVQKMRRDVPNFKGNVLEVEELTEVEQKIADNLCKFIKRNARLLHLDLSHMGIH